MIKCGNRPIMTKRLPHVAKGGNRLSVSFAAAHRWMHEGCSALLFVLQLRRGGYSCRVPQWRPQQAERTCWKQSKSLFCYLEQTSRCRRWRLCVGEMLFCVKMNTPDDAWQIFLKVTTTTAETCYSGTITSLFHHDGTFTTTLQIHFNKERVILLLRLPELSFIKQLISAEVWHRNVFTVGTRLMWSALPRGCSPRLCRLTGPLLYEQLRMLNCEKLSLSAAARAQIKVVGPGGG